MRRNGDRSRERGPPAGRRLAWVRWRDAAYQRGEHSAAELIQRVILTSAGLVVAEDAETISLALDLQQVEGVRWRHIEHIPKSNVLDIRRFDIDHVPED